MKRMGLIPERDPDRTRPPNKDGEWGEDIEGIRESDEDPNPFPSDAESLSDGNDDDDEEEEMTLTISVKLVAAILREMVRG